MNNKETNRNLKDTKLVAATKKKKLKENNEIPLKHGKLLTIILSIVTLIYVSPIFVVLMNSFKANTFVKTDTFAWPIGKALVGWANYIKGFTFGNYPFFKSAERNGIEAVNSVLLNKNGRYEIDFEDFERKIKQFKPAMFILVSPQNPTGRVFSKEELEKLPHVKQVSLTKQGSWKLILDDERAGRELFPILTQGQYIATFDQQAPTIDEIFKLESGVEV